MSKSQGILSLNEALRDLSPIHFVGVNGSGMRPLAEFAAKVASATGVKISGSDVEAYSGESAVQSSIEGTAESYRLLDAAKTVVYSSAITRAHPALARASLNSIRALHRSELLALFTRHYKTIAIAGTHGKSTTSALIVHALKIAGLDPSWIIGAPFANGELSYGCGKSTILVIEADESDGSFLRYSPTVAVLNNIEADHMDYYQSVGRLEQAFETYVKLVPSDGAVIYWQDSPAVLRAISSFRGRTSSFGSSADANMQLLTLTASGLHTASQIKAGSQTFGLSLPLAGQHNTLNAMAAISAAKFVGVSYEVAAAALGSFPGVKRRLQRYPAKSGVLVFDDYAHNPGKIRNCLGGLTAAFPDKSIVAVFQPHRYSRISSLYDEFMAAFQGPKISVVVVPVYASGETPLPGFEADTIAKDIAKGSGVKTFSAPTLKDASELVKSIIINGNELVVTLGAGDVWRVAENLSQEI